MGMKIWKWLLCFLGGCAAAVALYAGFNAAVDPFGVFGDRVMDWYAYDMTQNPRAAKIAYLNDRWADYDSYVVGSSKASSISCEKLNGYLDASFYNMTWYGGKLGDEVNAAKYLLEHDEVKNLVLLVEPQNILDFVTESADLKERMHCAADGSSPLLFYGSYLFSHPQYAVDKLTAARNQGHLVTPAAVYIPETGVYNKQRRDVEAIGALDAYMAKNGYQFPPLGTVTEGPYLDDCVAAVAELRALCAEKGVNFVVCTAPMYEADFRSYDRELLSRFWRGLAEAGEFWDFSGCTSVAADARYFYDTSHFRNAVGDMMLSRIFEDGGVWVPEDFGVLVTAENVEERLAVMWDAPSQTGNSVKVPILMYHSITAEPGEVTAYNVLDSAFRTQMEALRDAGYVTVGYDDLLDYVQRGTPLPEKAVVITFDDGYRNNLTLAAPILRECGFQAQIAVIGCSVGHETYKDTGAAMIPHFTVEEVLPWVEEGVLRLNSHTYDMHQNQGLDGEDCRQGVLQKPGEGEDDYLAALAADWAASSAQLAPAQTGDRAAVLTYPNGLYSELSEVALAELGVDVTVTTDGGVAQVVKGLPQSLRLLPRIMVTGDMSGEALLAVMAG